MKIYTDEDMVKIAIKCITRSIESCKTIEQLESCRKLLRNYKNSFWKMFNTIDYEYKAEIFEYIQTDSCFGDKFSLLELNINANKININARNK